ncbi:hypothetical protein AAVH_15087 [Aphelenchoides avenae]|nr:hypothetical protein AAVH_15087 [Aphelenchus avenae]
MPDSLPNINAEASQQSLAALAEFTPNSESPQALSLLPRRSERIFLKDSIPSEHRPSALQSTSSSKATIEQSSAAVNYGPAAIYSRGANKYFRHNSSSVKGHVFRFRRVAHTETDDTFTCIDCLNVVTHLELNANLARSVRVTDGIITADPEAKHICLKSSNGTLQPRISTGRSSMPKTTYTEADCEDEQYGQVTTEGRGLVSYYSTMHDRRLHFRLLGKSKHVPGVEEYYCMACREVDGKYTFIVCVKEGQFVAVDPDSSFSGHECIRVEQKRQQTGSTTRPSQQKPVVAKLAPKRKSTETLLDARPDTKKAAAPLPHPAPTSRLIKQPLRPLGSILASTSSMQDFGNAHSNDNGEVEWESQIHKGKTLRFVFHMLAPTGPVWYYRCDPCHALCGIHKNAGAVPRLLAVREDRLLRNPDECGTNFGHLCQMPKKVAELQRHRKRDRPQGKKARMSLMYEPMSTDIPVDEFHETNDVDLDDVAENFEDVLDEVDAARSLVPSDATGQVEPDAGLRTANVIETTSARASAAPLNDAAQANMEVQTAASSSRATGPKDSKPDVAALRQQQRTGLTVANISLHPDDDDEIEFLGVTHAERAHRRSSQLPEIENVSVTPDKPGGKPKARSSAVTLAAPLAKTAPATVSSAGQPTPCGPLPAASSIATSSRADDAAPRSRRRSCGFGPPQPATTAASSRQPAPTGTTSGVAQVTRQLEGIDDDELLLLELDDILEDPIPWTPRAAVKQEVKREDAVPARHKQEGMLPLVASKPPPGHVTNFGKAHFSPDGTLAFFTDILGKTYAFEQLEMLYETVNGEQTETRIYQCKTCIEAANRLGMTVDLQRVKTVNGYFVDIDPGRPRGNAHLCVRNLNN